ncbi:MAG: class D sortase [Bryobacteraceae bacterium]
MTRETPSGRLTRWLERTLLVMGTAAVGVWLTYLAMFTLGQSWDNWVFERESQGEGAAVTDYIREQQNRISGAIQSWLGLSALERRPLPQRGQPAHPSTPPNDGLIGRLTIPRLQVMTTVREGTTERTLALATGHIRGTTLPGQNGNVGVAGHRDTFFQGLAKIRVNDLIEFETREARYGYEVVSTDVVKPDAVDVLRAGRYPELTLVTCYPFDYIGSAPDRFIVKARQVSQYPLRQTLAEARRQQPSDREQSPKMEKPPEVEQPPEKQILPAVAGAADPPGRVAFQIIKGHSGQVAPGISVGVTDVDVAARRVDGWVWVMPDRRTVWLRDHRAKEPLIFYQDGERRELMIGSVTASAASGYLLRR